MGLLDISLQLVKTESVLKTIQMTDLVSQYHRLKDEIDSAIGEVMESASFINGPAVKRFASQLQTYTNIKHIIPCANGTDALQVALMALDIPAGSEIITPAFSYAAVVEVCSLLKLKPVFTDVDPHTFNMKTADIENLITPLTKAIVPVHLFGQCADMDKVMSIANKHGLYVIEDNAQAIGAYCLKSDGSKVMSGGMGHVSTLSFFPSKNLGCFGDGGAICTNDAALADKITMIANHGQRVKYYHELIGVNSRLDSIQAAILSVKLKYLESFTDERRQVANFYDEVLGGINELILPKRDMNSTHVFNQYTIQLKIGDVEKIRSSLKELGIPTMKYYPEPLYKQKAYKQNIILEHTEKLCNTVFSLPIGTDMNEEQLNYITQNLTEIIKQK